MYVYICIHTCMHTAISSLWPTSNFTSTTTTLNNNNNNNHNYDNNIIYTTHNIHIWLILCVCIVYCVCMYVYVICVTKYWYICQWYPTQDNGKSHVIHGRFFGERALEVSYTRVMPWLTWIKVVFWNHWFLRLFAVAQENYSAWLPKLSRPRRLQISWD